MTEAQATYETAEAPAAEAKPTYTVLVRLAFVADGRPISGLEAKGDFTIPAEGDTQLISIPIDAREFAQNFLPALAALAMRDAAKEARENVGKLETVEHGPLVGADGAPLASTRQQPNRATRRGHLTRVRD